MSGYIGSECLKVKMFEILDEDRRVDMIQSENSVLPYHCFLYLQKKKRKQKTIYHAMNIVPIMFYKKQKCKGYNIKQTSTQSERFCPL